MVELEESEDGRQLTIRLRDSVLFARGGAELTPGAADIIDRVGSALFEIGLPINVAGHTDDVPIRNGRFKLNRELSTARSTAVLVYLIDRLGFPPQSLSASGYGEYVPVAPNNTSENRAKYRRVEFVLTDDRIPPPRAQAAPPDLQRTISNPRQLSGATIYIRP